MFHTKLNGSLVRNALQYIGTFFLDFLYPFGLFFSLVKGAVSTLILATVMSVAVNFWIAAFFLLTMNN